MKKVCSLLVALVLCLSARAQVGPADPGVYVFVAPPVGPTPVEQWLMNEGSGQTFLTSSGSGDNLDGANITWASVAGFPGSVPVFNGSSTSATGVNQTNTNFTGTTPFSVCVWALITSGVSNGTFISTFQGGNFTGWEFSINAPGEALGLQLVNTPSNQTEVVTTIGTPEGAIHHFCATYDGVQNGSGLALYIDGVPQSVSIIQNSLSASIANTQPVVVGERPNNNTNFFNGNMADLRIYNLQLTAAQVSAIFAAGPQ